MHSVSWKWFLLRIQSVFVWLVLFIATTIHEIIQFRCRYVLECPECGVIYRSRQYWYGNREPVEIAVRVEIRHAWPGVSVICV